VVGNHIDVPKMQVLFFHGLPREDVPDLHLATRSNSDGLLWPQTWLMDDFPGAQIFFVTYGAALKIANFHMRDTAENLISDLLQANIGQVPGCPVVLVGHCIGGLVIKELCLNAYEELHLAKPSRTKKKFETFLNSIKGIFYYSSPILGIRQMSRTSYLLQNPLFKFFETLSTDAAVLNANFERLSRKYPKWEVEGVGASLEVQLVKMNFANKNFNLCHFNACR
jgi:hypothetical protein